VRGLDVPLCFSSCTTGHPVIAKIPVPVKKEEEGLNNPDGASMNKRKGRGTSIG
jgi:hypothetical protein